MVNKTPLVSVIMSVYDGLELKYLCAAAESILTQTYSNLEFLIVLDGVKREDIRKSLEDLKKSDCRVRLIYFADNKGLANAMNTAIKKAKGQFFVRMDADDVSHHDRVAKLVEHMVRRKDVDVAGSFIEEFCEESKVKRILEYPTEHEDIKNLFAKRNSIAHASVIFRRTFFDKAGYYPLFSIRNEDTLLFLSGFINGCKFSNLSEVLYSVRFSKKMASRRLGLKKSFSDLVDRLRVIIDLRASSINIFYAIGLFIIQNLPFDIYNFIRSKTICKKTRRIN